MDATAFAEGIERLAAAVLAQTQAELDRRYPGSTTTVNVKPGQAYTKIDVGPAHNMSGKYMVEHATGIIFGIKGYGKVHRGHVYGTLDTIGDWAWGGYTANRRPVDDHGPGCDGPLNCVCAVR